MVHWGLVILMWVWKPNVITNNDETGQLFIICAWHDAKSTALL